MLYRIYFTTSQNLENPNYSYDYDSIQFSFPRSSQNHVNRWYFGGIASCAAACFTHPLELLKVYQQMGQSNGSPTSLHKIIVKIYDKNGVRGFYNGISAGLLRQLTYATTRSALYDAFKKNYSLEDDKKYQFYEKAAFSCLSGAIAGFIGAPADLVNVRMQHDIKLSPRKRRNYKNAVNGIARICKKEGPLTLFNGASMASSRGCLMSIGTLAVYDHTKEVMLSYHVYDGACLHLCLSCHAAFTTTILVHPLDVLKTRTMSGHYQGLFDCFCCTAKQGIFEFYRGFMPSWLRATPHTALTFLFVEELRLWFGY